MDASYLNQYIVTVCHSSGRFAKNRKPNTHNSDSKVLPSAYRGEIALLALSVLYSLVKIRQIWPEPPKNCNILFDG